MLGVSRAAHLGGVRYEVAELMGPTVGAGDIGELFFTSTIGGDRWGYGAVSGSLAQATDCWHSANGDTSSAILHIRFDRPVVIETLDVWARETNDGIPSSWSFQYSDDNSTWTTASSATGANIAPNVSGSDPLSEPYGTVTTGVATAHQFWRLYITAVNTGTYTIIGEIRVNGYAKPDAFAPYGQLRFDRYGLLHGFQGFNNLPSYENRTFYSDTSSGYPSGINQWSYSYWELGPFTAGQYYFEAEATAIGGSNTMPIAIGDLSHTIRRSFTTNFGDNVPGSSYRSNGTVFAASTVSGGPAASFTAGDIIGAAVDFDLQRVEYFKNNVSQGVYQMVAPKDGGIGRWRAASIDYQAGGRSTIHTTATYTPPVGYTFVGDL